LTSWQKLQTSPVSYTIYHSIIMQQGTNLHHKTIYQKKLQKACWNWCHHQKAA